MKIRLEGEKKLRRIEGGGEKDFIFFHIAKNIFYINSGIGKKQTGEGEKGGGV